MLIKRFCLKLNTYIFCIIIFCILYAFFFLVSSSFKKHQIITVVIKTEWHRSHNSYCGNLVLVFEKLGTREVLFFSRCIKKKVFHLFSIQNADKNFIFIILSRTFLFRMAKPSEFCKSVLWRVTTDHDIKYRKENWKI